MLTRDMWFCNRYGKMLFTISYLNYVTKIECLIPCPIKNHKMAGQGVVILCTLLGHENLHWIKKCSLKIEWWFTITLVLPLRHLIWNKLPFHFKRLLLQEILDKSGYTLDVTTGQRKYGGPPPDWDGPQPGSGHEVINWCLNVKYMNPWLAK